MKQAETMLDVIRAKNGDKRGGFIDKIFLECVEEERYMAECIYSNNINKSILTYGFTIPVDKWDVFSRSLGTDLKKGEQKEITVWLGSLKYSATYTNVNLTGENARRTVYQI